jgi:hypothetical protein
VNHSQQSVVTQTRIGVGLVPARYKTEHRETVTSVKMNIEHPTSNFPEVNKHLSALGGLKCELIADRQRLI